MKHRLIANKGPIPQFLVKLLCAWLSDQSDPCDFPRDAKLSETLDELPADSLFAVFLEDDNILDISITEAIRYYAGHSYYAPIQRAGNHEAETAPDHGRYHSARLGALLPPIAGPVKVQLHILLLSWLFLSVSVEAQSVAGGIKAPAIETAKNVKAADLKPQSA
jgi:hypothetical protein